MRETITLFILALLCVSVVSADFVTEIVSSSTDVLPGQSARFTLEVQNFGNGPASYTLQSGESRYILTVDERPSAPIDSGEVAEFSILLTPTASAPFGARRVPVEIINRDTRTTQVIEPIVVVLDPSVQPAQYEPSVAVSTSSTSSVLPGSDALVRVSLRNRNARPYESLRVSIVSDAASDSYVTSLDGLEQKSTERTLSLSPILAPGEYPVRVDVFLDDTLLESAQTTFVVETVSQTSVDSSVETRFVGPKTVYTLTNEGNVESLVEFSHESNFFSRIFTRVDSSDVSYEDGRYGGFVAVAPGDSVDVTVSTNYVVLYVLIVGSIVGVFAYYLLRSPLVLFKEADVSGGVDDGESEVRTRILIKNRTNKTLSTVRVVDRFSGMAEVVKNSGLGTLKPTSVAKKPSQGTLIRWDLETIEPFEERIITYTVKTPLTLVGDVTLPPVRVSFETLGGTPRTTHSKEFSIRRL